LCVDIQDLTQIGPLSPTLSRIANASENMVQLRFFNSIHVNEIDRRRKLARRKSSNAFVR
jgi:hypothetical protein